MLATLRASTLRLAAKNVGGSIEQLARAIVDFRHLYLDHLAKLRHRLVISQFRQGDPCLGARAMCSFGIESFDKELG